MATRFKSLQTLARMENELAERERASGDKDVDDHLVSERNQLEQLKEQKLWWWEETEAQTRPRLLSQLRARTSAPTPEEKVIPKQGRRMSRIPVPVKKSKPEAYADKAMSGTPEHRLARLKAAKKEVFAHARLYENCVVSLLDNMSFFSASNKEQQREGSYWPPSSASGPYDSPLGNRTNSAVSLATSLEAADTRNAIFAEDSTRSSLAIEDFFVDESPPPIPKRSSRRVKVPFSSPSPNTTQLLSVSEMEKDVMPLCVYGYWLALQRELKELFNASDRSDLDEIGRSLVREDKDDNFREDRTLTPEPLNLSRCRRGTLGDAVAEKSMTYSLSEYGGDWI